ncbi:MAG: MEDS domain-containing protein [Planctomycetota bacterium]|jgi:PAS domain S-box-containing protein
MARESCGSTVQKSPDQDRNSEGVDSAVPLSAPAWSVDAPDRPRAASSLRPFEEIEPGDHLCCLYGTDEEHRAVLTPFLRQGLERGEKVVYIVDERAAEKILGYLRADGLDPAPYRDRGQLVVLDREDSYLAEGRFDPDGMVALLRAETAKALEEGYSALRVTGEMTWALRGDPGSERLIEYEAKLNEFFPGSRCLAICQYDRRRFPPEVLLEAMRTHPSVLIGTEIFENFYYIPCEDILGSNVAAATLENWIENLAKRRRNEQALQKSEEYFRAITECAQDSIFIKDSEYRYRFVNPAMAEFLSLPAEKILGRTTEELFGAETGESATEMDEIALSGRVTNVVRTFDINGVPKTIHSIKVPLKDRDGRITGICGIVRDVTDQKRAEESREKLQDRIKQAQKLESLGVLAGGIAHDFANILQVIRGNTSLAIEDLPPDSRAVEHLEEVEQSARHATELCRQMLAYSGKGKFVVGPLDLGDIVRETRHMLNASISKKAELRCELAETLPLIEGDPTQLTQVVMNLVTNASDALGDRSGVICVRTGVSDCDRECLASVHLDGRLPEGTYVSLEVADTGCGMDEETRQKIFDPFFTTKFTGRGLGLAAVSGIVRGHGGAISVETEVGLGSTFRVFLPIDEEPCSEPVCAKSESTAPRWSGAGTVLVADDEEAVRELSEEVLERAGFDVLLAEDGREAIRTFRAHADEIVCVLLDLTMPEMDGEEAFRTIRKIRRDVPVLIASGYSRDALSGELSSKGLAGFLQKPYLPDELLASLRDILG